jgi:hypothetical protein
VPVPRRKTHLWPRRSKQEFGTKREPSTFRPTRFTRDFFASREAGIIHGFAFQPRVESQFSICSSLWECNPGDAEKLLY